MEAFHAIPLDEPSRKSMQCITPFGVYRYRRGEMGFQATVDAYNKRFDMITKDVNNMVRQVDDSLLRDKTIKENFESNCNLLTFCGRNGICRNPEKFQLCLKEVNLSGFVLGEDSVCPTPHLTDNI